MQNQKILYQALLGGNRPSNNLQQMLDNAEHLHKLVDQDNFVSEFKSSTQRVNSYMTYSRFQDLISLVTVVGDQTDNKRAYKFPLIACEMLVSDNSQIDQFILPSQGVVIIQKKVTKSVEKEIQKEIQDDDSDDEEEKQEQKREKQLQNVNSEKKQEDEDEFGEFVKAPTKKTKIVKMKEVVDIVETFKEEHQPLIKKFFEYLSGPINYTLTGYVCKILVNLLNRKTSELMKYLFEKKDENTKIFQNIFSHLGSRSTVDLLTRIFTIQNNNFIDQRFQAFTQMIEYLKKTQKIDSLSNITACLGQVYQKLAAHFKLVSPVQQLKIYINSIPQLLMKLLRILSEQKQLALSYSVTAICTLLSNFDICFQHVKISNWIKDYIQESLKKLIQIVQGDRVRLGVAGFKIVQSYNICLKEGSLSSVFYQMKELFSTLIKLIKKYPFNNIFQNQVLKLILTLLSSASDKNNIQEDVLVQWLEQQAKDEEDRRNNKESMPRKGYYGHLFKLCNFITENQSKSTFVENFSQNKRLTYVRNILVQKEAEFEQRMLGGFEKNKKKHPIMYDKGSILEAYSTFLASAPQPVQEKDLDDPTMNPILLQQLQKQLDGVDIVNEAAPQEVVEEEHHKAELIEENEHHKNAFWKVHLDYDVDGLMEELS